MAACLGSFAAITFLGIGLGRNPKWIGIAAATLGASALFFVVTNWAVWFVSGMYPHTLLGLVTCYVAALPFWGNALVGDIGYTAALFIGYYTFDRYQAGHRFAN